MENEQTVTTNVELPLQTHSKLKATCGLLRIYQRDAVTEAIERWLEKNAPDEIKRYQHGDAGD